MKSALLLTSLLAIAGAQQNETVMSDFQFFTAVTYNGYNGFLRGFYREHAQNVVSDQCLGSWVTSNLTHLDEVWEQIADMDILAITYEDALEAAEDIVKLIYKNREYCAIDKVIADFESICNAEKCLDDLDVWTNIKNNVFPIFSKVEAVAEYLFNSNDLTDKDILLMVDQLGESYGGIISIIIGFDKRFITQKF